jgi:hypothetical protein
MESRDSPRRHWIEAAIARRSGDVADIASQLWLPLASQLTSLVGQGGVNSLYFRCLHLCRPKFAWLPIGDGSPFGSFELTDLRSSLASRHAAEANEALLALLVTFTAVLAAVIGDALTDDILRSAWGEQSNEFGANKESADA